MQPIANAIGCFWLMAEAKLAWTTSSNENSRLDQRSDRLHSMLCRTSGPGMSEGFRPTKSLRENLFQTYLEPYLPANSTAPVLASVMR